MNNTEQVEYLVMYHTTVRQWVLQTHPVLAQKEISDSMQAVKWLPTNFQFCNTENKNYCKRSANPVITISAQHTTLNTPAIIQFC